MKATGRNCDYCGLPFTGSGYSPDGESHYCCYGCHLVSEIVHARQDEGIAAWVLLRLGIGAFLAMNVMMLSLVLYTTPAAELGLSAVRGLHWVLLALSTPILVILGSPFLSGSLRDLKQARVGMDVLIFTGSVSAYLVSARSTILGQGHVYFDTSAMLLLIVTLGKFLEVSVKSRTGAAVRDALELIPATARVVRAGVETEVASGEIRVGDRMIVRPGESIPADGLVVSGECSITEAAFTGEPGPRVCTPGDTVYGGSIDHDGLITVEVTAAGGASLLAQVQEMARRAQMERAPIERIAERLSTVFIPAVWIVAMGAAFYWGVIAKDLERGGLSALSVLVVACPCALGLATPLAASLAIGKAARSGVLIRSGEVLERLCAIRTICFDKTGTLTTGRLSVSGIDTASGVTADELLAHAATVEAGSEHAVAGAIIKEAQARGIGTGELIRFTAIPGHGAEGEIHLGGNTQRVNVGSLGYLLSQHRLPKVLAGKDDRDLQTSIYVGWAGEIRGRITLSDSIRLEAAPVIASLRSDGIGTALVSGDRIGPAAQVARELGIGEVFAELSPAGKAAILREMWKRTPAMVGDGINDAPALAAAHVGIAVAGGTKLAQYSSDVILMGDDLTRIPEVLALSRFTYRVIRQNLFWAFGYNSIAIGAAFLGRLHPLIAATAMLASSTVVIANSLRIERWSPDRA